MQRTKKKKRGGRRTRPWDICTNPDEIAEILRKDRAKHKRTSQKPERSKMTTRVELITPAKATTYLEKNKSNRPLNKTHVDKLVKLMNNELYTPNGKPDEFLETHHGIAFDPEGNLFDGQHRLHAIVISGKAQYLNVSRNVDPRTFTAIDTIGHCRPRTSGDGFAIMSGITKGSQAYCGCARAMLYAQGVLGGKHKAFIAEFANEHHEIIGKILKSVGKSKISGIPMIHAAFTHATMVHSFNKLMPHMVRLRDQTFINVTDPMRKLHVKLENAKFDRAIRTRLDGISVYNLACSAIKAAIVGRDVQVLRPITDGFNVRKN